ncbi:MAG: hypothetical protein E6Q93_07440 [Burkholderiaceae bacterium]|nr:MAG: hypothetical protein E6Q93_07440 [Burkholderiaceae bacterium]
MLEEAFRRHARRCAAVCMDCNLSFAQLDELSAALGAWLQSRGLARGARVALMMPNVLQYPVAIREWEVDSAAGRESAGASKKDVG